MAKVDVSARKRELEEGGYNAETGEGDVSKKTKHMDRADVNYTVSVVGQYRRTSQSGNPVRVIRFICVDARDRVSGDVVADQIGRILDVDYTLIDSTMFRMIDLVIGYGFDGAFDPENDDEVADIFANSKTGLVRLRLKYKGDWTRQDGTVVKQFEPERYFRFPEGVEPPPDTDEIINKGIDDFEKYLEYKRKNPPKAKASGGGGGGGSHGGGGDGGAEHDDIPF